VVGVLVLSQHTQELLQYIYTFIIIKSFPLEIFITQIWCPKILNIFTHIYSVYTWTCDYSYPQLNSEKTAPKSQGCTVGSIFYYAGLVFLLFKIFFTIQVFTTRCEVVPLCDERWDQEACMCKGRMILWPQPKGGGHGCLDTYAEWMTTDYWRS
jgi:hypothetical protein